MKIRDLNDNLDEIESIKDSQIKMEAIVTYDNSSSICQLPPDIQFNDGHRLSIILYSCLFVFSSIANITVLVLLLKRRRKKSSRIIIMLIHLTIADLLVTFLLMPLEIIWSYTVVWIAGDFLCRLMSFFRTFGIYLSSFILVCISIDRYFAVLKPLSLAASEKSGIFLIVSAWIGATLCSIPQAVVFHVETHPHIPCYTQCVTFNSYPSYIYEVLYSVFTMVMMYGLPLAIMIYTYAAILREIYRRTRNSSSADSITRSSMPFLSKAKIHTLKMTIMILCVFFVCWTPYYIMCLWYWIDRESAAEVDQRIQKFLFMFACTNSCMNPLVYGAFNIRAFKKAVAREARDTTLKVTTRNNFVNISNSEERGKPSALDHNISTLTLL